MARVDPFTPAPSHPRGRRRHVRELRRAWLDGRLDPAPGLDDNLNPLIDILFDEILEGRTRLDPTSLREVQRRPGRG